MIKKQQLKKIKEHNNDYLAVIKEYILQDKKQQKQKQINQPIKK